MFLSTSSNHLHSVPIPPFLEFFHVQIRSRWISIGPWSKNCFSSKPWWDTSRLEPTKTFTWCAFTGDLGLFNDIARAVLNASSIRDYFHKPTFTSYPQENELEVANDIQKFPYHPQAHLDQAAIDVWSWGAWRIRMSPLSRGMITQFLSLSFVTRQWKEWIFKLHVLYIFCSLMPTQRY